MGHPVTDITGQRFGRLTVMKRAPPRGKTRNAWWQCQCDCGQVVEVSSSALRKGDTKSCGCLRRENYERYIGKTKPAVATTPDKDKVVRRWVF